ncbi:MAG: TIGR02452 family protein, partial [Synergistaceae bacterium]|nr:TIGR02452 family protein [Synergistaceae bacterium]
NNEEIGSLGAQNIRDYHRELFEELNNHQYMIEFDRRNACDYKVYDIPVTEEFKSFIEANTGYKEADRHSSTDIRILCEKVCGVNLSVDYDYEHTVWECLNFHEWENTLNIARKMLEPEQQKFLLRHQNETLAQRKIRMDKLIRIFADTQIFYKSDPVLIEAVKFGKRHTKLYKADDYPDLPAIPEKLGATFTVKSRSFQTAMNFHQEMPDKKIAVLNFASAIHPGGGVLSGSRAQEECLCRCSTLYPLIDQKWLKESYYIPNKEHYNFRHDDACIYSEGVVICKSDTDFPERLKTEEFITVDVITCAAPDLRKARYSDCNVKELFEIHIQRAKHILHIAALHGVDILVTGAFGCGAFKNDPELVAEAWKEALEEYRKKFEYVIFAIYFREHEIENFKAFNEKIE